MDVVLLLKGKTTHKWTWQSLLRFKLFCGHHAQASVCHGITQFFHHSSLLQLEPNHNMMSSGPPFPEIHHSHSDSASVFPLTLTYMLIDLRNNKLEAWMPLVSTNIGLFIVVSLSSGADYICRGHSRLSLIYNHQADNSHGPMQVHTLTPQRAWDPRELSAALSSSSCCLFFPGRNSSLCQ